MVDITLRMLCEKPRAAIAAAQDEPVQVTDSEDGPGAVLVSHEFFDRAVLALEDQADVMVLEQAQSNTEPALPFVRSTEQADP